MLDPCAVEGDVGNSGGSGPEEGDDAGNAGLFCVDIGAGLIGHVEWEEISFGA